MTLEEGRSYRQPYSRKRERSDYVMPDRVYTETSADGTVTTYLANTSTLAVGEYQTTTDVVTPGYRTRIARGEIIQRPFTSKKLVYSHYYAGFEYRKNSGTGATKVLFGSPHWYSTPPSMGTSSRPTSAPISSVMKEAVTLAVSKVNSVDVEGLVELAEAHKVRDTFKWRLDAFDKHLDRQLSRSKTLTAAAARALGGINNVASSNWLRYRYGIMPLLYLLDDAMSGDAVKPVRKTEIGYATWSWSNSIETIRNSGNFYTDTWTTTEDYELSARAGCMYRPDWTLNRYGISLREVPSAMWELTTLSFVLDWGVNVGTWIRANAVSLGLKQLARWVTTKETFTRTNDITSSSWKNYPGYTNLKSPSGGNTVVVETTNRFINPSYGLTVRRGSLQKLLAGDKRLIDSWALSWNKFNRLLYRTRP